MKTFAISCSALMTVMLLAVLCSASVHNCVNTTLCDYLLKSIMAEAENLTKLHLDQQVPRISKGICQKNFFCLAEKVLENITHDTHVRHVRNTAPTRISAKDKFKRLKRLLNQYNKQTKETNCDLNTNGTYSLTTFLKKVDICADHAYNHTR